MQKFTFNITFQQEKAKTIASSNKIRQSIAEKIQIPNIKQKNYIDTKIMKWGVKQVV